MDENEINEAIKKAEDCLEKAPNAQFSREAIATVGVGYAILALAKVLKAGLDKKD
jgi:hypothetical protein